MSGSIPLALTEGDLRFEFPNAIDAMQFDDASHGLSHCMKAVDFIVEFPSYFLFVEVKDPEIPTNQVDQIEEHIRNARQQCVERFIAEHESGELRKQLVTKFRDSFIYRWAENQLAKPVHYFVLLELPSVDLADLLVKADELRKHLPFSRVGMPNDRWKSGIVGECQLLDLSNWNEKLPWPVERISDSQQSA